MSTNLHNLEPHSCSAGTVTLDLAISKPQEENIPATDHYEILRVRPDADEETIERIYRTLADRFNPDNPATGDADTFLRVQEAWETLSDQSRRAEYNVLRKQTSGPTRFWLQGREFFNGVRGAQNRRLALLCILYRKRTSTHDYPGLTILELELLTGCTREEITSALWYLCEKEWAAVGEFTAYSITVDGFDFVESKLEHRLEFRALATLCYYGLPGELDAAQTGSGFGNLDTLPLDIEPDITNEGDGSLANYYQILGIGPHEDQEAIERVYSTLTARFHPDNPSTGNTKAFLRIREAYETLSDPAKRTQYNALLQGNSYSERFRLRGREFFDGIRGEQLRRLAVLCILYRQSASELPGLTVLDLEHWTGCTREELGSALWYLREKKWAKCGSFTEYSITATGFDIIENKLDHRETPRPRVFSVPGDDNESVSAQPDAAQPEGRTVVPVTPQSPGVSGMNYSNRAMAEPAGGVAVSAAKRVIFSMGGKGGVGKTSVMTGLAEWYEENRIPAILLDLDTENKACGSLTHFFGGRVPKINIHTPAGLDTFIDQLCEDAPVVLADMGAGAGQVTHDWFEKMYPDVAEAGVVFTAVGVVTSDPASVESVLAWAAALQGRVDYVIVENSLTEHSDFSYWRERDQAEGFQKRFQPAIVRLDNRLAELEKSVRNHGVTLGQVAARSANAPELKKASLVMRAQSYRRRMFAEFDKVKDLLLP
jgi:curved DNA-binding protein CbpA